MGDLSEHFSRSEFACKCGCEFDTVDAELIKVLEKIRAYFQKPVTINSACRCINHNRNIGSKDTSQHVKGKAADIVVKGINSKNVHEFLIGKFKVRYGIGKYDTFTHIDVRSNKARW